MLASSSGAAVSSSSVSRPSAPTKKSADAKWTPIQEEKLVAVVMAEKAYIKTEVTVQKKFEMVAAKLLLDRDFFLDAAFAGKEWQAFQKKFNKLKDNFKARYAFDEEGANLSGLDGNTRASMSSMDSMLFAMLSEVEAASEQRKLLTEKEKERNKSCLRHEAVGLAAKSVVQRTPDAREDAADNEDDLTTSGSKTGAFDGFLSKMHESNTALELKEKELEMKETELKIEEAKGKTQEAKNKELELRLALQREKNNRIMMKQFKKSKKRKHSDTEVSSGTESDEEEER
jgi:hypothetical protein